MVDTSELTFTYTTPTPTLDVGVLLEADEWDTYDGVITSTAIVDAISKLAFGTGDDIQTSTSVSGINGYVNIGVDCSKSDGSIVTNVYAYPRPHNLSYSVHTPHGTLADSVQEIKEFREIIQIELLDVSDSVSPEYPVYSVKSYDWIGDVYDENGSVVNKPTITLIDGNFYVSEKIYGSLDVVYNVKRTIHTLTIDSTEELSSFSQYTFVYALCYAGASYVSIDKTVDDTDINSMCSDGGSSSTVVFNDDLPIVQPKDRTQTYDYCSGELLSDVVG